MKPFQHENDLMREAKKLHQAGRLLEAANVYQRILRSNAQHFEALYGLGMAHAQTGRLKEGEQLLAEALNCNRDFAEGWRARGLMLTHLGRHEEALACLDTALALKPDFPEASSLRLEVLVEWTASADQLAAINAALERDPADAARWNSRGSLLAATGNIEEALLSFERALAIKTDFVEALCNRATLFLETQKPEQALSAFDAVLALDPKIAIAWNNRGNALGQMKRFEEALASYGRALALRPDFHEAAENRDFALFALGRNTRGPAKYMRGLFDEFSSHYDETMLGKLGYRAHLHVREMAERVMPRPLSPNRILDLGCGTGLVGLAFKDVAAGLIDGVDISPKMIEAARAREIYGTLVVGDLETVLAESGASYDLIVSADTMTYFGDLTQVFAHVAQRLTPGGFYIFASEAKIGEGWEQTDVHRFRHSETYLRAEAASAGLTFIDIMECTLRREKNEPVRGFAVALRKAAA